MLFTSRPARRKSAKSLVSAMAMAIALTGGAAVVSGAAPATVAAQDYTDDWAGAYQPVADVVNAEGGDVASVAGQFDAIVALVENADERFATGNLVLIAGNKTNSPEWQRRGLELMLESGKVAPESVAQFQWFVGNIAFNMGDYNEAREALLAAQAAGWTENDPVGLIAETYYQQDDVSGAVAFIEGEVADADAAGREVPAQWMLRALQAAYEYGELDPAIDSGLLLVTHQPSETHWMNALQVVNALAEVDESVQLDLLRLMRTTNSLTTAGEYSRYIAAADPRIMSNELDSLLADGLRKGFYEESDPYYIDVRSQIDARMAGDREEAPTMVQEAEADTTGESALLAGDVLLSLSDWAGAEAMYLMAAEKGGVDTNLALLRAGMMQARQGKGDAAEATLAQVSGPRELPAKFWAAYAQTL